MSKSTFGLSVLPLLVVSPVVRSFTPESPCVVFTQRSRWTPWSLLATLDSEFPQQQQPEQQQAQDQSQGYPQHEEEENISDLDARVLRSMLTDGSLDLLTEDDMRKLLERASGPKDSSLPPIPSTEESDYESKTLQALMDTKLWKALSAKKDDILESAKIYIENRIERDTKLLASLGIFLWDRVVRDVARALPAAGSSGAAVGQAVRTATRQLTGSSSSVSTSNSNEASASNDTRSLENVNLFEEMNTPLDEIKSVTQTIQDILKGETSSSGPKRGIRTAAPAGQKTRSERQQRAFQKRKQTVLKREKDGVNVLKVAGSVVDAAYEVRRDFQVEVNKPGYKSERVRNAIAAGAETTSRVIAAAREGPRGAWKNILFGSNEKEQVLELEGSETYIPQELELPELPSIPDVPTLSVPDVPLPAELIDEQISVVSRLQLCIEKPEDTWLTQGVLARSSVPLNPDSLRDVVTAMIFARDDLAVMVPEPKSIKELIVKLRKVKSTIDSVISIAMAAGSPEVAENLRNILYGYEPGDEIQPTLLSLNDIQSIYENDVFQAEAQAQASYEEAIADRNRILLEWERVFEERERLIKEAKDLAAKVAADENFSLKRQQAPEMDVVEFGEKAIDASFEKLSLTSTSFKSNVEVIVDDYFLESAVAEVVLDDEGLEANDVEFRTISGATTDDGDEEPNALADATLRSLDVVLAVTEKAIMLLPGVVEVANVASSRLDDASRSGLGRIGWRRLDHADKGSKRY